MKKTIVTLLCLCAAATGFAQQTEPETTPVEQLEQKVSVLESAVLKLQKLKVSGYVQTQWQWGEENASLKVGSTANENPGHPYSRIGVRRGRIKFVYEEGIASATFQPDITEKGVSVKDVYLAVKDPLFGTNVLKAGIFDRTFGNEIAYSSSRRESPERSTIVQELFPGERDLGVALTLQAAKTSKWNFLKLEAGLFAGNGINIDNSKCKDFIGHLSAVKQIGNDISFGGGISYYNGGVFQSTKNVYRMRGSSFAVDSTESNKGGYAKREYIGIDAQFAVMSAAGMTQLRAEYIFGEQPGGRDAYRSPNSGTLGTMPLPMGDTYIRDFSGGYVILVQDFGTLPLSAVFKYDWFNPNTKISGDEAGKTGDAATNTNRRDISLNTLGCGLLWRINPNLRLQAYYEFNKNETSANLSGYDKDRKDDVFTLRLQYKF